MSSRNINDASRSINDASRSINDASKVMIQIVTSLTIVIYL